MAVGQVRRDTAFYREPLPPPSRPGREGPRKYGNKYTPDEIAALPTEIVSLRIYGQWQKIRLQAIIAKAR